MQFIQWNQKIIENLLKDRIEENCWPLKLQSSLLVESAKAHEPFHDFLRQVNLIAFSVTLFFLLLLLIKSDLLSFKVT